MPHYMVHSMLNYTPYYTPHYTMYYMRHYTPLCNMHWIPCIVHNIDLHNMDCREMEIELMELEQELKTELELKLGLDKEGGG